MSGAPDVILEGGYLPVNAELIERRLNEIWSQGSDDPDQKRLVKLCLANMLIVADADSRIEAEHLAQNIATRNPSRVLLIVVDELLSTYSAFVRTACEFNAELDAFVCWEIVEILSDESRSDNISGAVRSLLVDAVPVITIDFRAYQSTPAFDAELHEMSDYYLVQAEVVPATGHANRMIPLGWYRTLIVRELLGTVFGCLAQQGKVTIPQEIIVYYHQSLARLDPLLAGWLVSRLADGGKFETSGNRVRLQYHHSPVTLRWELTHEPAPVLEIIFADTGRLRVVAERDEQGGYRNAEARYNDAVYARPGSQIDLPSYILAATGNGSEFAEYAAVQRVCTMLPIP